MKILFVFSLVLSHLIVYSANNDSSMCIKAEEQVHLNAILNPNNNHVDSFESLKSCSSNDDEFYLKKGRFLFANGNYDQSKIIINNLLLGRTISKEMRGEAFYYIGKSNFELGKYPTAISNFQNAIEEGYDLWNSKFELARSFYKNGNNKESVSVYKEILKHNKYNGSAWNNIGVNYEVGKMHNWALACYKVADSLSGGNKPLYKSNIIQSYLFQNKEKEALEYGQEAYEKFPTNSGVIDNYCWALNRNNQNEKALQNAIKGLKSNPTDYGLYFRIGHTYSLLNKFDSSLANYFRAIHFNPKHTQSLGNIAWVYLLYGKDETAIEYAQKALAVDNDFVKGYGYIYDAYVDLREYEKALDILAIYQERFQDDELLVGRLGYMNLMFGNYETAIIYFQQDIDDGPSSDSKPFNNTARCYALLGDTINAIKFFNKAISIDSNNSFIYHNRASMYANIGNSALACQDLQKSLELDYNWDIDSNLIAVCQEYCPDLSIDRKIIFHGYKGNKENEGHKNLKMIELTEKNKIKEDSSSASAIVIDKKFEYSNRQETLNENYVIFPNPTNGKFQIKKNHDSGGLNQSIRIYNFSSQLVFETVYNRFEEERIDISSLKNGTYILIISDKTRVLYTSKIVLVN